MIIYVDVDGTITSEQRGRSFYKVPLRQDVIDKVKKLENEGHEIVIWTGNTKYAQDVAKKIGLKTTICARKPDLIIDNQVRRFSRKLKRKVISPEDFLTMDFNNDKKL